MSDTPEPILRAQSRLEKAQAEVARWSDFIRMWKELEGETGVVAVQPVTREQETVSPPQDIAPPVRPRGRAPGQTSKSDELSASIIAERGPMMTKALLPLLADQGHAVTGKDPYGTLHTRLTRGTRLHFDKTVGWKLRDRPSGHAASDAEPTDGSANRNHDHDEGDTAMAARDSPAE